MNGRKTAKERIAHFDEKNYEISDSTCLPIRRHSHTVEINGLVATVTMHLEDGVRSIDYPLVTMEEIAVAAKAGQSINLDYCYVYGFNYSFIVEHCESPNVILNGFSARNTFFDGITNFDEAHFPSQKKAFKGAQFAGEETTFRNARFFDGNVSFKYAQFTSDLVSFRGARFGEGAVLFIRSRFTGSKLSFRFVQFSNGNISFKGTHMKKSEVLFVLARFGLGDLAFDDVVAPESTFVFSNSTFPDHTNMRVKDVGALVFTDCIIEKALFLNRPTETGGDRMNIRALCLERTLNLGTITIDFPVAKHAIAAYGQIENATAEEKRNQNRKKALDMRILKENFHKLGEYDKEDLAFVEYMRYKSASLSSPYLKAVYRFVDRVGRYGTGPGWVFLSMLTIILLFGVIFSGFVPFTEISVKDGIPEAFGGFFQGIYFSVITFLTIGYGDVSPQNGITAFFAGIEGFLGLFLMSYFTVAIVRKTLR